MRPFSSPFRDQVGQLLDRIPNIRQRAGGGGDGMSDSDKLRAALERAECNLVQIEQRARELIVFADGAEEAGLVMYAQRARDVARDLLRVAKDLRAERSVRGSIQTERDRLREMLSRYAPDVAA